MAVGFLGLFGIVLLAAAGIIPSDPQTLFLAVGIVVFLLIIVMLGTLASIDSTDECFDEG
jgi:ABC-type multidrug transport system permease subunit